MGDPLWLTVINNNAQWGIVHLVAREKPMQLAGRLESLQGLESYDKPQGQIIQLPMSTHTGTKILEISVQRQ